MAVAQAYRTKSRRMTEAEFILLPNDGRKYELVDGEKLEVPVNYLHDFIVARLIFLLWPAAMGRGYVAAGQAGFRMKSANIRCPDVSYTSKKRMPGGPPNTFGEEAPDLCVEIISQSENRMDMDRKLIEYFDSGAVQVWRMYPELEEIEVYTSPLTFRALTSKDNIDGGELLPDFHAKVSDLFVIE